MPDTILELVGLYGYPVLVASVLLMNAGVPLPGHVIYVAAAILAGRGALALPLVMSLSAAAAILGSLAGFTIGTRGGRRLAEVHGPRLGLSPKRLGALERFFDRHGAKAIFLTRFFVVIRTFGAIFAGISRFPTRRFALLSSAGAIAWAGLFGAAGYVFGDSWHIIEGWLLGGGLVVLAVLAVAGLAHVVMRRRRA